VSVVHYADDYFDYEAFPQSSSIATPSAMVRRSSLSRSTRRVDGRLRPRTLRLS